MPALSFVGYSVNGCHTSLHSASRDSSSFVKSITFHSSLLPLTLSCHALSTIQRFGNFVMASKTFTSSFVTSLSSVRKLEIVMVVSFLFFVVEIASKCRCDGHARSQLTHRQVGFKTRTLVLVADAFHCV